MNGSDCGMFSCKFAEYISRRAKITFSQQVQFVPSLCLSLLLSFLVTLSVSFSCSPVSLPSTSVVGPRSLRSLSWYSVVHSLYLSLALFPRHSFCIFLSFCGNFAENISRRAKITFSQQVQCVPSLLLSPYLSSLFDLEGLV